MPSSAFKVFTRSWAGDSGRTNMPVSSSWCLSSDTYWASMDGWCLMPMGALVLAHGVSYCMRSHFGVSSISASTWLRLWRHVQGGNIDFMPSRLVRSCTCHPPLNILQGYWLQIELLSQGNCQLHTRK